MKLLFDPIQLEKESQMAKKKSAKSELNMSEEIRQALGKLGLDAPAKEVGDMITAKHPSVAAKVAHKNWGVAVSGIRVKMKGGGTKTSKTKPNPKKRGGKVFGGAATTNGMLSDVAVFALKHGGIDGAKAALDQLAEQIGG